VQGIGDRDHVVNLVSARKRAPIEKDTSLGIASEQRSRSGQYQLQNKIILARRILDFLRGEESVPKLVFTQHSTRSAHSKFMGQCSFTRSGQTSHKNNHKKGILQD